MNNWLMVAYILASDYGYLEKNDEGHIDFYLDKPEIFPFPSGHKINLHEVPTIFPYWELDSRHQAIDIEVTDDQWIMMIELCESGAAFFSRYNNDSDRHDGPIRFLLSANDVFYWACSDCESVLFDEVAEVYAIWKNSGSNGLVRWMCERRGMRPQVPLIDSMRKQLFNMDWIDHLDMP